MAKLPEIQVISVPAVVINGRVYLVNSRGRRIGKGIFRTTLKSAIADDDILQLKWRIAVFRMAGKGYYESKKVPNLLTPWQRRCAAIVSGLNVRWRSLPSKTKRRSWDKFKTTTWDEALGRIYQQGYKAFKYHNADPWRKWARTVAKNHNRKAEYRHAEQAASGDRIGYHVHDRAPTVQMCLEWVSA